MAIINTGYERAATLTITRKAENEVLETKVYNVYDSFGAESEITKEQLQSMEINAYRSRVEAFKAYVEEVESGVTVDLNTIHRQNLTSCPLL